MPSLAQLPLFERLRGARSVLVAGAGGGFDVYAGVPLYLHLRAAGVDAHLANLSFTNLRARGAARVCDALYRVDAASDRERASYFPEAWLCAWLAARGEVDPVVWSFELTGVRPLHAAYARLRDELALDAVVLVDGGTDILMRGDESGLGTPDEDLASLAAVSLLDVPTRALACIGFGVDAFHGVCHSHFLENTAALDAVGGFWGASSMLRSMPEVAAYVDLVRSVHDAHPDELSIVNGSIVAALVGRFGDAHFTRRTATTELYINPLMALCWAYDLGVVAAHALALPALLQTDTIEQVASAIAATSARVARRPHAAIPV